MVAVIIPCYNEEKRFKRKEWRNYILSRSNFHFFFVDDGSTDNTSNILKKNFHKTANAQIIELSNNVGKGPAIRSALLGINMTLYDYFAFIDSDLEIPLNQLDNLHKAMLDKPNSLVGLTYRKFKNNKSTAIRSLGSIIIRRLSTSIINSSHKISDTQCGCKIFSTGIIEIFKDEFISKWLFDIEIILRFRDTYGIDRNKLINVGLEKLNIVEGKSNYTVREIKKIFNDLYLINRCYN